MGCKTKKEVEKLGVHVGCVITYPDEFHVLNKDNFVCRALDNRIGGFMIAEVARLIHENKKKLPFGLYITNSVQEEVGLRGAEMIDVGTAEEMYKASHEFFNNCDIAILSAAVADFTPKTVASQKIIH